MAVVVGFGILLATSSAFPAGAAAAGSTIAFSTPGLYDASGPSVRAFAPADFNGDGKLDVAAANLNGSLSSKGLPVLLGDGAGHLSAPVLTQFPGTNESALDVAAADFDGDGKQDLAVPTITGSGSTATYRLRILRGNGDGTFTMGAVIPGANDRVLAGDLDADGRPDIAYLTTSKTAIPSIVVALGNGDATFRPGVSYSPGFSISIEDLRLADANGDAALDLVFLEGCPTVRLNDGHGAFGAEICSPDPQARIGGVALAAADFNSDGKLDIATGDASGGHVTISLGDGAGKFTLFKQYSGIAYQVIDIEAADWSGDGKADIVAPADPSYTGTETSFVFMRGLGNGTFAGLDKYVSGGYGFAVGNFNGDQWLDLVATDLMSTGDAFVTLNDGSGTFHAPRVFSTKGSGASVSSADLNGDARPDLVIPVANSLHTHLNTGKSKFGPERDSVAGGTVSSLALGDINADGKVDAVAGSTGTKNVLVMLGKGTGTFGASTGFAAGGTGTVTAVSLDDVTGDGKVDAVAATGGQISVLPGTGTGTLGAAIRSGTSGTSLQVADFTGDGVLDAASSVKTGSPNVGSGVTYLNAGAGDGTFTRIQSLTVASNFALDAAADLTGDGLADYAIVGSQGTDGGQTGMFVYTNLGGSFAAPVRYSVGSTGLQLADFNRDGAVDAAVSCSTDPCPTTASMLGTYANGGSGTFGAFASLGTEYYPYSITAADFTGDGRIDMVVMIPGVSQSDFELYTNTTP